MAQFLGSQGRDIAGLRATNEVIGQLKRRIAAAQGAHAEADVARFLAGLAERFAGEASTEQSFQSVHAGLLRDVTAAEAAALPSLLASGRTLVAEHFVRCGSPLAVQEALSDLFDAVLRRLVTLARDGGDDWCFLASGWLGRREVSFCSGFSGSYIGRDAGPVAAVVLPALTMLGLTVDPRPGSGGLGWYESLDAWQAAVTALTAAGDDACGRLADLRCIAGDEAAAVTALATARSGLQRWRQSAAFTQAARQVSGLRLALGFFGGLKVERSGAHRGALNIDAQALYPLIANIRNLAIGTDLRVVGTADRVRELVRRGRLNVEPASRVMEALHHLQGWKLAAERDGGFTPELDRYVWPERLSTREQELLRDSLEDIAGLERLVVQHLAGMT